MADRKVRLRTRPLDASKSSASSPPPKESIWNKLTPHALRDKLRALMENGDHWAIEILDGDDPYLLVELQQTAGVSSFSPVFVDPKNFREPGGVMSALLRRFYGETDSTNKEIIKIAKKTIGRQKKYRLFSSNCQRFAMFVCHDIQTETTYEFDLVYGNQMSAQAKANIAKKD